LTSEDLTQYGISSDALDRNVSLDETLVVDPDEPFSRDNLLSLLWDLNVPGTGLARHLAAGGQE